MPSIRAMVTEVRQVAWSATICVISTIVPGRDNLKLTVRP